MPSQDCPSYFVVMDFPDNDFESVDFLTALDDEEAVAVFRDRLSELLCCTEFLSKRCVVTLFRLTESGFNGEATDDLIVLDEFVHEAVYVVAAVHDKAH
jgi:hypothetical protein